MTERKDPGGCRREGAVPRRQFLKLAGMAGLLAACGPARQAVAPSTQPPTATPVPSDTPTRAPSATPTGTATRTSTSTPSPAPSATPPPTATATPAPTATSAAEPGEMARVAFVKTDNRAEGVRGAIDLLGINPVEGKTVFIKPNCNSSDPAPASTHPDVLRSVVLQLREMGAREITVGDRSGQGVTEAVMREMGVFDLADDLSFQVVNFSKLFEPAEWAPIRLREGHWKQGFSVPRCCLDAGAIVSVCCLKTHQYGGHFTMSLKNSVGLVPVNDLATNHPLMDELHSSPYQRLMIAEINTAYTPSLVVLDGVQAFASGGPAQGRLVSPGVVLVGSDRVAIDAVGVALLRYFKTTAVVAAGPVFQQEQIARAVELGLGVDSPHKIELVTPDAESAAFAAEIREILLGG